MRLLILCVFVVSPLIGIAWGAIHAWSNRVTNFKDTFVLAILGAAYLGLINTTKIPDSDLAVYLDWYALAQDLNLIEYLGLFTREPLYYAWMYLVSKVSNGNEAAFTFFSTVVTYTLILHNVARISRHFALSNRVTVLLLVTFIFFGPLFSLSAHLMRQFFAAALVLTFYTAWIVTGKRQWWILIGALFVHYSAVLFILFAAIKMPRKFRPALSLVLMTVLLAVVFVFVRKVSSAMVNMPLFGMIFSRIASDEGHDIGHLSISALAFVASIAGLAVSNLKSRLMSSSESVLSVNITVILLAIIVLFANASDATVEIAKRFYFYQYFLFALALASSTLTSRYRAILIVMPLIAAPHFFLNIEMGAWQYTNLARLAFLPSWELWGR